MHKNPVKYVFVFGGVLSGLRKGIVASSLGFLLKSRGYKITINKLEFVYERFIHPKFISGPIL